MKILITKNSSPLSKVIRWGLNESASHFVLQFGKHTVLHSNLFGCHLEFSKAFFKSSQLVEELVIPMPLEIEDMIYESTMDACYGNGYDIGALAFFSVAVARKKAFGTALPKANLWGDRRLYLCTAIGAALPPWMTGGIEQDIAEMTSPFALFSLIKERYMAGLFDEYILKVE